MYFQHPFYLNMKGKERERRLSQMSLIKAFSLWRRNNFTRGGKFILSAGNQHVLVEGKMQVMWNIKTRFDQQHKFCYLDIFF